MKKSISIVIPCYNEENNINNTYKETKVVLDELSEYYKFQIIFVDDGSTDSTLDKILSISKKDNSITLIKLSRNFGKEIATSAGINYTNTNATIVMDADGQHPPIVIKEFIREWNGGANIVIGMRTSNSGEGLIKKYGSIIFYKLFNRISGTNLAAGSTDFRLIDNNVIEEFKKLSENDRITRALIDWIGFKKSYVYFEARERFAGKASYSYKKLFTLALNSFVTMSYTPLYIIGYLGLIIMLTSTLLGIFSIVEKFILKDPLNINITGSAFIGIAILFLVGLILFTQGIFSLYIAKIYKETKRRPLYIVDKSRSINL